MAITGSAMESNIRSALNARGMMGVAVQPTSNAIGFAIATVLTGMSNAASIDTGIGPGAGSGIGQFTVVIDSSLGGLITGKAQSYGLIGRYTQSYCYGVAEGIARTIRTGMTSTTHAPVAVGTGIGRVIGAALSGGTVSGLIMGNMSANGMQGQYMPTLSRAIGEGFAAWVPSVVIQIMISGAPGSPPVPTGGTGIGTIS